jgi:hypothetical protein
MAYEPKDGSGALFRNDKKGNEARPDYRGDLMLGGTLYEVAGWMKEGAKGKFMSISVKPKEAREVRQDKPQTVAADDDIPF